MRTFTDNLGHEWTLDINVGAVKRVRDSTGVLLTSLFDDGLKVVGELCADYIKLVDVLWVIVKPQAATEQIDVDRFAEGMGGDSLATATEALVRATADFFTSQDQRESLNEAIDVVLKTAVKFTALTKKSMATALAELDPDQLAQNCLDFVTSGQASPALTQIPEHAASSA